jgi:hypothetical protein
VSTTLSTEIAGPRKTSVRIYQTIRRHTRKHTTLCHACCSFVADVVTLSVSQTDRHVHIFTVPEPFSFGWTFPPITYSAFCTVSSLRTGYTCWFDSWQRQEYIFLSPKHPDWLRLNGYRVLSLVVKRPGLEGPSSAEVMNEWSYTSIPYMPSWRYMDMLTLNPKPHHTIKCKANS